jgi:hypothetical protein
VEEIEQKLGYALSKYSQEEASTQRSLHYAPPDFLFSLVALTNFRNATELDRKSG